MSRLLATLLVAACAALASVGAGAAAAGRTSADAVATATTFARAVILGDVRACTTVGGSVSASLKLLGVPCADFVSMMPTQLDQIDTYATFADVEDAANEVLVSRNGSWMPKRGAVETLVRELRAIDSALVVRSGRGATAARAARAGVVVVDAASTPSRLILHTRARSGQVWTSVMRPGKKAAIAPSAVRGAPLFDPIGPGARVIATSPGHTTVLAPFRHEGDGVMLVGVSDAGVIDLMLFGGAFPQAGLATEPVDAAVVGPDIQAAWAKPTMGGVCGLAGGRLDGSVDGWCAGSNPFASGAVDIAVHPYDAPVAGEATMVDVTLHIEGQTVALAHFVSHDAAGTHLHGIFIDAIALGALARKVGNLPL